MARLPALVRRPGSPPAFGHRNYRLFFAGQSVSLVGTQMQNLALVWLVLLLSHDPLMVGVVTAAQGLPIATLTLIGGVAADRLPRRRLLMVTQGSMLVLALVLGILTLTQAVAVWQIVALAFALGCANAVDMPARQAFVFEMVGPADVGSAVGLYSALYSACRLVGPALAGLAIAALTAATGNGVIATGAVFLVNAATFAAVIAALAMIREGQLHPTDPVTGRSKNVRREILDGLRYLRSARPVLVTLLVPGAIAILAVNSNVLIPVYAREIGLSAADVGLLLSAVALGALLAALWIGLGGAAGPRLVIGGALLLGVSTLLLGLIAIPLVWPALLFGTGLGASAMRTAANTQIQLATPGPFRGRVMSVFSIVYEGASPLGGLVAGAFAALGGAAAAFAVTGGAAIVVLILGLRPILAPHEPAAASGRQNA